MKKFSAACLLALPLLMACGANPRVPSFLEERPLNTVDLIYPNIEVEFLPSGEKRKSVVSFPPPNTIDCSRLTLKPDAFGDAIDAGALVVKIKTPPQVKHTVKNKDGTETVKVVNLKPGGYGGVLALCNVSGFAKGPDSRSYRIRGLDEYLIKGKDGLISVVGAVLSYRNKSELPKELIDSKTGVPSISFTPYSWMLWLTDRSVTFTEYETKEVDNRKASKPRPTTPAVSAPRTP